MEPYDYTRSTPQKDSDKKNYFIAALVVMGGLVAILGFLYFNERNERETLSSRTVAQQREIIKTNTKLDSISTQLDAKIAEIRMLGGNIDELMQLKTKLEIDKQNIINATEADIKKYEAKIKEYNVILAQKDKDIVKLREENGLLTTQNQELTTNNEGLKTEIEKTKQSYGDSLSTLKNNNKELTDKINIAAALKAQNVMVYAINSNGKQREKIKADKIDQIRIAFGLGDNALTEKNEKEIYVRVLDPSGAIISDMATGSGTFMYQNKEMIFTTKKDITYQGNGQQVDVIYKRGIPFKKGKHQIELFSEGVKIGEGTFEVRSGLF
ncbi:MULTISPECIES: hypothetical protein [unclassified Siphonobacter]|uniref:hypothetical protein n=1 Tax=unclassified Siphonobacter TaxID=2635712 RepID=UPI0027820059|nr:MULTISPECIES: hypothetical protein [unclassified Siphonobacter]MDQ1089503.1 ribosomal protein L24 [Siphonobacter sp. SORGH_AS_1065]MDR6195743.1 ribosomal protein L24 [Siphonobacter sp. SORGH_AS_0500]